jgi:hypothetical protein
MSETKNVSDRILQQTASYSSAKDVSVNKVRYNHPYVTYLVYFELLITHRLRSKETLSPTATSKPSALSIKSVRSMKSILSPRSITSRKSTASVTSNNSVTTQKSAMKENEVTNEETAIVDRNLSSSSEDVSLKKVRSNHQNAPCTKLCCYLTTGQTFRDQFLSNLNIA